MKKFFTVSLMAVFLLFVWGGYHYLQHQQKLREYDQSVKDSITISHLGNTKEKEDFAEKIYLKMKENPDNLHWKKLYSTIQIGFFKNYQNAISVMNEIYQETKDNNVLIGICLLKEKINEPYQECYEQVLKNVTAPYYNDLNYWAAVGGLKKDYSEQDMEKSKLPKEGIAAFLTKDRQTLLNNMF
ncbi:hypothetical protein [Glaesserella sp.]|uniref:hypothetical protein n=1 Tax=Glaesserella sp. TaxID=2094731 RepID=UPI00359FC44A